MKLSILAAVCLVATGCVTIPSVGSSVWHEQRMAEIDQAYLNWEITEEQYLQLKSDTDAMRSDYLNRLEQRRYTNFHFGIGLGYYPYCWW